MIAFFFGCSSSRELLTDLNETLGRPCLISDYCVLCMIVLLLLRSTGSGW